MVLEMAERLLWHFNCKTWCSLWTSHFIDINNRTKVHSSFCFECLVSLNPRREESDCLKYARFLKLFPLYKLWQMAQKNCGCFLLEKKNPSVNLLARLFWCVGASACCAVPLRRSCAVKAPCSVLLSCFSCRPSDHWPIHHVEKGLQHGGHIFTIIFLWSIQ